VNPYPRYIIGCSLIVKEYKRFYAEALRPYAFTPAEIDVLMYLAGNPGADTARDVCLQRGISKALVSRSVDSLVKKGYVVAVADETDRRVFHLQLTDQAQEVKQALLLMRRRFRARILAGIERERIESFEQTLDAMVANLNRRKRLKRSAVLAEKKLGQANLVDIV